MRRHLSVSALLATLALAVPHALNAQRLSDLPTLSSYQPPSAAFGVLDSTRQKVGDYRWEAALFLGLLGGVALAADDFGESCPVGSPSTVSSPCGGELYTQLVSGLVIGGLLGLFIGSRIPKYGPAGAP